MKSDALFYELFQAAPQTFFELLQITPPCPYHFESLTVKTTERRVDGIFEPDILGEITYFLEVQAYLDQCIYWRVMREVATYFEQRGEAGKNEWQAIVLFLDSAYDPGYGSLKALSRGPSPRLLSVDLPERLRSLPNEALALNVLRPLIVDSDVEVRANVTIWVDHIQQASALPETVRQRLVMIMSQLIVQKFETLTYKELSEMLNLTPLEETKDGKELLKNHSVNMLAEMTQEKFTLSSQTREEVCTNLSKLPLENLEDLFRHIIAMETLDQLNQWIKAHISKMDQ